jgi:hypothetical protein
MSTNELAAKIVGLRRTDGQPFDPPCELGFHCPVCKYDLATDGEYDERLEWSEYNGFLWCSVCDEDYPSALCMPDIHRAVKIYLMCVKEGCRPQESQIKILDRANWWRLL